MGLVDILRGADDWIDDRIADASPRYREWMQQDALRVQQQKEHPSFFNPVRDIAADLGGFDALAREIPGVGAVMDAPSRSWDTLFITAAHASAKGYQQSGDSDDTDWGAFFNRSSWERAWSSWGSETHATAGAIWTARAITDDERVYGLDPLDAKDAQAIQAAAGRTWYGDVMAATTDLGFSMVVPGLGTATSGLKAARSAKELKNLDEVERVSARFAETGGEGAKITPARDTTDLMLGRQQNVDSLIGRMVDSAEKTDDIHDLDSMLAHLGPMMENSPDAAKVAVADIFVQANKLDDVDLRNQAKINAMLAAQGSKAARERLVQDHPLLAKNLEEMTSGPRTVALLEELRDARQLGASDDSINAVMERHYGRASDQIELDALRDAVEKAAIDAQKARELATAARDAKLSPQARKVAGLTRRHQETRFATADAARVAQGELELAQGFAKSKAAEVSAVKADMEQYRPGLNRANDLLNEILLLGDDASFTATGRIQATALDSIKTRLRLMAGDEHEMRFGDANTPVLVKKLADRAARFALAPQARGSINLVEADLGQRQMADALKRAGVYGRDEIRQAQQDLLSAPAAKRQMVVARYQEQMLERIALKHFGDEFPDPAEALKHARAVTKQSMNVWGQGNKWVVKAAGEQKGKGKIIFRTPEGQAVVIDEAMLQSQLADSAPFLDPEVFDKALRANKGDVASRLRHGVDVFADANDMATALWKHGALLRPGLAVRASLDNELRALALMDTAEIAMASMAGVANLTRNTSSALTRILFKDRDVAEGAVRRLSMDLRPVMVSVGAGRRERFAFSRDADERTRNQSAMTKGANEPYRFYFTEMNRHLSKYRSERARWDRYKADSPHWVSSYLEYAEQLLASPTGRWLAERAHRGDPVDVGELMESPAFKAEFLKVAQPKGFTRWEFARQVLHEVETMFPDARLVEATRLHKLTPKMVEDSFPRQTRFDVPGPHQSAIQLGFMETVNKWTGRMYKILLDKPDMWLSRNPTGTMLYRRHLQDEVGALRKGLADGESIDPRLLEIADRRARTKAIGTVRRTFFDTTRSTSLTHHASRLSPFFLAWEDAMVSWTRLIHDDPRRLVKLGAAYNAAGTLSPYLPQSLLVDRDGKPLRRGESHDNGAFIALPFKVAKVDSGGGLLSYANPANYRVRGPDGEGSQMRVRLEAINSIAQGETWWLPGFGPQAQLAVTNVLGRWLDPDVALDIIGTDNWLGKQILRSMYLEGELPRTDAKAQAASVMPGYVRQIARDAFGDNYAMNIQRNTNYLIAEDLRQGRTPDDRRLREIHEQAERNARAAAVVRFVSGTGFGMTGSATVDGQFYVEQMRQAEAMPPEQLKAMGFGSPEEYLSHLHPQMADLDMSISRNESGIVATATAQKASFRLRGVLKDHPEDVGWMVLGRANIDGADEFSSTAYNMQVSAGDRKKMSPDEVKHEAAASLGWKKYRNMRSQLDLLAEKYGIPAGHEVLSEVKRRYTQYLMQNNGAWAKEWSERQDRFGYLYSQAQALSSDGRLKGRSDMEAFRQYDTARREVMARLGIKSLNGTSRERVLARKALAQAGEKLAERDFGFQQMWERFLSQEVEDVDGAG